MLAAILSVWPAGAAMIGNDLKSDHSCPKQV
jgi:hypothetical protein